MECDEYSPALLPTVIHPSLPFSFQLFHPLFGLFSLFSFLFCHSFPLLFTSSHSFMPVHFSVPALFHNNSPLSSCRHYFPHSNSISLSHTLRSSSHSFFPVPLLFSYPFVGPHCLIPSFFLSALVLPLRAALKRHACSVVLHVNRIIGYGVLSAGGNITDCHQWNWSRSHPASPTHTQTQSYSHSFIHSRSAPSLIRSLLRPLPLINSCCLCRMSQQYWRLQPTLPTLSLSLSLVVLKPRELLI